MDKVILLDLAKRFWKWMVIISLLVIIYFLFNRTQQLETKITNEVSKAKEHEIKAKFYKGLYDKLAEQDNALEVKYDSLVIEKNKIKNIYHEKIKIIDRYTISDMQSYFNDRTK